MLLYKVGRFFYKKKVPCSAFVFNGLIRLIHNSAVFVETEIGKNTIFGYGGVALVIHKRAVIGNRCTIGSCVTIGGRSNSHGVPVIGDDVYIATGAKILGDITIGEGSVIGANAVVITSIPPKSLVVGVPARVIRSDIDFKQYI